RRTDSPPARFTDANGAASLTHLRKYHICIIACSLFLFLRHLQHQAHSELRRQNHCPTTPQVMGSQTADKDDDGDDQVFKFQS
ncbi:hypothetical protein TorRG33x02_289340, partial [Trema orientale]